MACYCFLLVVLDVVSGMLVRVLVLILNSLC